MIHKFSPEKITIIILSLALIATSTSTIITTHARVSIPTATSTRIYPAELYIFEQKNSARNRGACFRIRDIDDSGYTYITTLRGTLTASTVDCSL